MIQVASYKEQEDLETATFVNSPIKLVKAFLCTERQPQHSCFLESYCAFPLPSFSDLIFPRTSPGDFFSRRFFEWSYAKKVITWGVICFFAIIILRESKLKLIFKYFPKTTLNMAELCWWYEFISKFMQGVPASFCCLYCSNIVAKSTSTIKLV